MVWTEGIEKLNMKLNDQHYKSQIILTHKINFLKINVVPQTEIWRNWGISCKNKLTKLT